VYSTFLEDNQRDFSWNGKDGYGNEMPSGLYFIRISGNDGTDIAKVLYTK
jgi:flagellar hook assembly protein FlgD